MKLLTAAIINKLLKAPIYSTDAKDVSPIIVKFFTPWSNWTWYAVEGNPIKDSTGAVIDWEFFGLVEGHERELGYFVLSELQSIRGQFGLKIERDMHFDNMELVKSTKTVRKVQS